MNEIQWATPEYYKTPKKADWYIAVSVIALSLIAMGIMLDNMLLVILIIIAVFTLFLLSKKDPPEIVCKIIERGVVVEDNLYPFGSIESFWIDDSDHEKPKMFLKLKSGYHPIITIPLHEAPIEEIHEAMQKKTKEAEHLEPLSQKIMEYLGF